MVRNYGKDFDFRETILRVPSKAIPQLPTVVIHSSLASLPSIECHLIQLTLSYNLSTLITFVIVVLTNMKCP